MLEKTRRSAVIFFVLVLLMSAMPSGCGNAANDSIAATVYGENIERKDIEDFLKLVCLYMPDSEEAYSQEGYAELLEERALWYLIESKIVEHEVKRLGLEVDEQKVEQEFLSVKDELVKDVYGSEEDYLARLDELEIGEDSIKNFHRKTLFTELLYEHVSEDISEEEARSYVEENPQFLEKPAQVYAFHILLEDEEKAFDVLELLQEGADFAEVGREHSVDDYVELGLISSHDGFDPAFLEAAFELEPGEISRPVETAFGFHIIKITEKEDAGVFAFEDVKEFVVARLKGESLEKYLQELMEKADIETFEKTNE